MLYSHLDLLSATIQSSFPEVYQHMTKDQEDEKFLYLYFAEIFYTIFVSELQNITPKIAVHIFDVFLMEGETVIFTLLINFIKRMEKNILNVPDLDDLLIFMKKELPYECLKQYPMHELLDFRATVEMATNETHCFL